MAEFISDDDKLQEWKYQISEFTIIYPGKTYNIPLERLTSFSIDNNYEKDLFPIVKANMTIEPSIYQEMVKNKNDLKIKMRMQKFYIDRDTQEKSLLRDAFNTTFSLILDDDFIDTDAKIDKAETASNENMEQKEQTDQLNQRQQGGNNEFYLYKEEIINAMHTQINDVLTSVNMIGAISYVAAKAKLTKILLSPLENNTSYAEILLPPQTALSTLQYLDTEYGFYRMGSIIFFGVDRSYIVNYKGGCTAFEKDEVQETCFLIPEKAGKHSNDEGSLEKPNEKQKRNYIVAKADNIDPQNNSVSNDVTGGNQVTIVNTNTNSITQASGQSMQRGAGHSNIVSTNSNNKWLGDTYAAQSAANASVLNLSTGSIDINAVAPNKKFTFAFEDSAYAEKYKGTYVIASYNLQFEKSGSEFDVNTSMSFKKVSNDVTVNSADV